MKPNRPPMNGISSNIGGCFPGNLFVIARARVMTAKANATKLQYTYHGLSNIMQMQRIMASLKINTGHATMKLSQWAIVRSSALSKDSANAV